MEDALKKKGGRPKRKKGRRPKRKKEDDLKKKRKTNQSTKINLIGCDTIVNAPSSY